MNLYGKILKFSFSITVSAEVIIVPNVKLTSDLFYPRPLIWTATHLSEHFFSQKSLGCLIDYSFDCLGHLTKMAATPIYGITIFSIISCN